MSTNTNRLALNPVTGLWFDGTAFRAAERSAAKPIPSTLSESLFRLMWDCPIELVPLQEAVAPAAVPTTATTTAPASVSRPGLVLINPKNGVTFSSPFADDAAAIASLEKVNANMTTRTSFASSILEAARGRRASAAQRFWLHKLAADTDGRDKTDAVKVNLEGLRKMFTSAKTKLKRPAIVLALADRTEVKIALAGSKSTFHGSLIVSSPKFGGAYYGRVTPEGDYLPGRNANPQVLALLQSLSRDGAGTAASHGHLTGRCCFCNRTLDDARSTAVGYGKVCAGHFGLEWGKVKAIA